MKNAERSTFDEAVRSLRCLVGDLSAEGRAIRVLEAGCGSGRKVEWLFQLKQNAHIVGIDVSRDALEKNSVVTQKIIGDIQTYLLDPGSFDLIICYDVLEHLPHPEKAIENFGRAIREGGLIVLASPLVNSMKGLVTKLTPHWFHVFAYRYLLGHKDAGKPGCVPFPTFLRLSMSPDSIERFAQERKLTVEYFCTYGDDMWAPLMKQHRVLGVALGIVGKALEAVSFGKISTDASDFFCVLRKSAPVAHHFPQNGVDLTAQSDINLFM